VYRIAYAFSPLEFSGALVFIYTVRALFDTREGKSFVRSQSEPRSTTLVQSSLASANESIKTDSSVNQQNQETILYIQPRSHLN
jgi:hypothetical protein